MPANFWKQPATPVTWSHYAHEALRGELLAECVEWAFDIMATLALVLMPL